MFAYIIAIPQDTRYQSNLNEIGLSEQKSFLDKIQNVASGIGGPRAPPSMTAWTAPMPTALWQ